MTRENQPRVSVVIPAYNAEDLVGHALESVLSQTCSAHEIIVVDDGSTDGTWKVVQRFGEGVRYIYQENAGPSAARNVGIKQATGDWVAFVDSDDIWLPNKIESEARILADCPDLDWVATNHYLCVFGSDERFLRFDPGRIPEGILQRSALPSFVEALTWGLGWDPLGLLIRREVLLDAGGFRAGLHYAEDLDLCLNIARTHPRVGFCTEPVAVHYIDRPEGLCKKQPVFRHMKTLRGIFDEHLSSASNDGTIMSLQAIFRTIVQDQMATLLLEGRRIEMVKVYAEYTDLLSTRYLSQMQVLGLLPPMARRALYHKLQWKIRR